MSDLRLPLGKCCTKCEEWKLFGEFHRDKRGKYGRGPWCKSCKALYQQRWYKKNQEHHLKVGQQWLAKNRERRREYLRKWQEDNEEHIRELNQRWRHENAELWREYGRSWREENLERARELERVKSQARRARQISNGGSFTVEEWQALCEAVGGKCLCCGYVKPLTIDHVIPLSLGGTNDISNIQPLCRTCNCRKGTAATDYR